MIEVPECVAVVILGSPGPQLVQRTTGIFIASVNTTEWGTQAAFAESPCQFSRQRPLKRGGSSASLSYTSSSSSQQVTNKIGPQQPVEATTVHSFQCESFNPPFFSLAANSWVDFPRPPL